MTAAPGASAGFDPARLAAVISPLRRTLLAAARAAGSLPDIPDAQIQIIRALETAEAPTPGELATRLRLDRSTISNLLAAMERSGLVERRRSPADRRFVRVSLSARARGIFAAFDDASSRLLARASGALRPEELATIGAALPALERLSEALADAPEPDPDPADRAGPAAAIDPAAVATSGGAEQERA
ncbi:MarR family transcriptional regulator [Leucobacter allii]|uniref:MarR family transcriptional regulator n=1 Tax=Leucobacter allii TaxID=2932247 RepID=A0ABY4FPH4_9MICO|nr:MarR family transcriptional regulator [Leucobacter allii]UOQ58185.1 MarR family transcriptional regulator [Leucobacter allii]